MAGVSKGHSHPRHQPGQNTFFPAVISQALLRITIAAGTAYQRTGLTEAPSRMTARKIRRRAAVLPSISACSRVTDSVAISSAGWYTVMSSG